MDVRESDLLAALRRLPFPGFRRDLVSLGVVRRVAVEGGRVVVEIDPGPGGPALAAEIEGAVRTALERLAGVSEVRFVRPAPTGGAPALRMAGAPPSPSRAGALDATLIPDVARTIAVASGKGGVGKSTVAVNLAVAMARAGRRVGLLDADIYGPSIPLMTGIRERPELTADKRLVPFLRYGVRWMSLGFLVDPSEAVIWRGPMVMKAIEQLLRDVDWGALDVLVVDMPPGTGDAQLTLSQRVRLAGAVIVTTPQDVALADARKGVAMFEKVSVPVLGIVENMSYFVCPSCSHRAEIFGHGGGAAEARRLGVPFLGEVPLDADVRSGGDAGRPIVDRAPDSPPGAALGAIATRVLEILAAEEGDGGASGSAQGSLFERFRAVWQKPGTS